MNIFYFTKDHKLNARLLDDKRVVKMVLETTQLLSNTLFLNRKKAPYLPTHLKHPCTIWASRSMANWNWLKKYGLSLAREYKKRYKRTHKCEFIIKSMKCPKIKNNNFYEPPKCMPDKYKLSTTELSYMNYYINEKFNENYFKHASKSVLNFWKIVIFLNTLLKNNN